MALRFAGVAEPTPSPIADVIYLIEAGALAFLYLNSAIRLRRAGDAPPEPTFKPKRLTVG
ncbi:hypothetical protein [Agromyces lapidis]|uniref:Uncharacterized protein n=1 Tax=Agromyces lapidis TaxID=279574 RepID=A0ABV5SMW2_9MICO|nr:hypothetical protein [Agromyces lapidis]